MSVPFQKLDRQRRMLSWLGGVLVCALCATLVLLTGSSEGIGFNLEQRWPTLLGLSGMVLVFVFYVQHKHRQLASLEQRLREYAVREATMQARFSELSFLFDITTQLQLRLDLQGMLDLAVQRLMPCLEAHQCSIMLHDPETGLLEVKATAGLDAGMVLGSKLKPGEGVAGHVFATSEVMTITPELIRKRFPEQTKPGRHLVAGLCVPMRFRGTPIGVMSVTRTSGEPFGETHARMLESFADHCAATVVKTHHHHDLLSQMTRAA